MYALARFRLYRVCYYLCLLWVHLTSPMILSYVPPTRHCKSLDVYSLLFEHHQYRRYSGQPRLSMHQSDRRGCQYREYGICFSRLIKPVL